MPFTVDDFHDLMRLLDTRPEWRAELRRALLTDELLALPEQLAALRAITERRFQDLVEAQQRTEIQLAELAQRVTSLTEAQQRTGSTLLELTGIVHTLVNDVTELKGDNLERRYRERAGAYFGRLLRRVRVLSTQELTDLLDEAVERGVLSEPEADAVTWSDLVVQGRRRDDDAQAALLVEISWGIGPQDVERAAERAALLTRAGLAALPVVAGRAITAEALTEARRL